ncbi:MAG: PLP-dependent transferase [Bacteroidales bacterium]|jgi:O-acetylhomoserine (thiol)-lyase|nr:PLP-dependent transferase [Bacteroidales bacterium]
MKNEYESKLYQTAFPLKDAYNALQMPVYTSVAFEFESAEAIESAFVGQSAAPTYSRISNPTVLYFENRVRNITGAGSVTALNSGMAAISNTFIALAFAGANIVTSRHLFGNTYSFLNSTLRDFDVEARFCDMNNPTEVKSCIDSNTCALFLEIITNPQLEIVDLKKLSAVAREMGVPLIADTTVVPFCAFDAKQFGVDIELVSSTKYISGGATSVGGLIVDYGTYDWQKSKKLRSLAEKFGKLAFTVKMKKEIHRNLGAYMTPQVASQQTSGLETLSLRFFRAAASCLKLAEELSECKEIVSVNYPGLPDNPHYKTSNAQFGAYPGAMLTFDLPSREHCFAFLNRLKLIKRATNLFDNKSLAIHPESTIYGTFPAEERKKMNISPTTIRLSVGLENPDELLDDLKQSLYG